MPVNDNTLYPMLGIGAFMPLFWTGFLLGHAAGLHCLLLLLSGLAFGWLGSWSVAHLESLANGRRRSAPAPAMHELPDHTRLATRRTVQPT